MRRDILLILVMIIILLVLALIPVFLPPSSPSEPQQDMTVSVPSDIPVSSPSVSPSPSVSLPSGGVKCWGRNIHGILGDGTTTDPVGSVTPIALEQGVSKIAVGDHNCAIKSGALYCWGDNRFGQCGQAETERIATPTLVSGMEQGVTDVVVDSNHTCAIQNGGVKCWGTGSHGELGNGTQGLYVKSSIPVPVTGLDRNVTALATNEGTTCALQNRTLKCWGMTGTGLFRFPVWREYQQYNQPIAIEGMTDVDDIAIGGGYICVLRQGTLQCWGDNDCGTLGNGNREYPQQPTYVSGTERGGVTSVAAGARQACALQDETLKCWGTDDPSRSTGSRLFPTAIPGMDHGISAFSIGLYDICAIQAGALKCWRYKAPAPLVDIPMPGMDRNVIAVSLDYEHGCAIQQ